MKMGKQLGIMQGLRVLACFAVLMLLMGCVSTKPGYELSPDDSWSRFGSACAGPLDSWERRIGEGALLEVQLYRGSGGTAIHLEFALAEGRTVKLLDRTVEVSVAGGAPSAHEIHAFGFGAKDPESGQIWVPFETIPADEVLVGRDSFRNVPVDWMPRRGDRFWATVPVGPADPIERFAVQLPPMLVNGVSTSLPTIEFHFTRLTFVQCLQ
jgi:hypothetical protein